MAWQHQQRKWRSSRANSNNSVISNVSKSVKSNQRESGEEIAWRQRRSKEAAVASKAAKKSQPTS